ncbi:restriction endonuclease subunit S [Campylobacter concisus]|uniref:restriction endonuclease subunit S n=1 Tax=Campylobacter concisus TaxID=199 RepID=UPI000D30D43F|nr:restriction endonuclease subunit S [Campylobacter concisus]
MSEFKNLPSGWKVVRLGDAFDFLKTYTNSRESLNDYDEISYIHYGEIHKKYKFYLDFRVASLPKIHQSKLGGKPEFIKNGDLVIADASEDYIDIAKSVEIKNLEHKAVAGLHTFLLRDKGDYFADGYKGYILYEPWVAKELKKKATGISVLGISKSNLLNLKIKLPPLDEQKKIAEILSTWDEAINLTINLIESKKQFKKALMQNLLTAKIRFPEFQDKWERVKLKEIAEVYQPQTISQRELTDGGFDVYGANGIIGKYGRYNHEFEQVVIGCRGNCGAVNFTKPKSWITGNAMVINLDNSTKAIKTFIYYLLSNTNFQYLISGSGQPQITSNIRYHKIKLPNLKEQQKIADVLTACDDEINLLNLKLENLKKQKQGLMQKLLSGNIRTKVKGGKNVKMDD